ncbi:MAG: gfo/Idh/MocA family oxidoreductase, partial [Clostridiales bacterium]|nr:gfo/Idh/MocA family oxidoreductase [Clostridiales bacterium]
VLMEKPLSASEKECADLLAAQKKHGGKVMVCHVLRYAKGFTRAAELIDEGAIGKLVSIQALEQVGYWHQAHSYVRGNWRRSEETTPMILAKCCHDLDLLQWYAKSKCVSVSSTGDLAFFNRAHKPEGAADRCLQCKYIDSCPYSAKRIYIDNWKSAGKPDNIWPQNVITLQNPLTEEAMREALQNGPYGRCVFACDNNVVDHQIVQMQFENGVNASLTMMAFTANGGRIIRFFGTKGEIVLNEEEDTIYVKPFGEKPETIRIAAIAIVEGGHSHGGGDFGLITALYDVLTGEQPANTSLEASVESHLMGIAAEKSRLNGGVCVQVHE